MGYIMFNEINQNHPRYSISERSTDQPVEYRKVQAILGDISFNVVLPKKYSLALGLKKGDFVKVSQAGNRLIIEKA
jgi:hypothetical protein